ncbi:MAG: hypothetical protein WDN01_16830 [Rhizomicrobium sp.]
MTSVAPFELRLPRPALAVARPQEIASVIQFTYAAETIAAAKQWVAKARAALTSAKADAAADAVEKTIAFINEALASHLPADFVRSDEALIARALAVPGFRTCLEEIFGGPPRSPPFPINSDAQEPSGADGYLAAFFWEEIETLSKWHRTPTAAELAAYLSHDRATSRALANFNTAMPGLNVLRLMLRDEAAIQFNSKLSKEFGTPLNRLLGVSDSVARKFIGAKVWDKYLSFRAKKLQKDESIPDLLDVLLKVTRYAQDEILCLVRCNSSPNEVPENSDALSAEQAAQLASKCLVVGGCLLSDYRTYSDKFRRTAFDRNMLQFAKFHGDNQPSDKAAGRIDRRSKKNATLNEQIAELDKVRYPVRKLNSFVEFAFEVISEGVIGNDKTNLEKRRESIEEWLASLDKFATDNPDTPISSYVRRTLPSPIRHLLEPSPLSEQRPLPTKAPALWAKDRKPGDTPASFFARVYEPWVGRMTRKDVGRLDHAWYAALSNWLRRNEIPADIDLPTVSEMNDRLLDQFQVRERTLDRQADDSAKFRELKRLASAMQRRTGKKEL